MNPARDERGTVSVLVIGFFLVIVLTVAVVVDASAAYLRRQSLANLADSAALAAADGVKAEQVYTRGLGGEQPIDLDVARRYAATYLEQVGAARDHAGLRLHVWARGGAVVVRLEAALDLPLAPPDWEEAPRVSGEAAAYVEVGE